MSQQELLRRVVEVLDAAAVDYMLTGSLASSLQGEPRSSHDIDLVVALTPAGGNALLEAFAPPDYYLDELSIKSALDEPGAGRQFNLLHAAEGDKVDFWMLSNEAFDQSRFSRKYTDEIEGLRIKVSRPEDTILMKLRWADLSGGSEKQFRDALSVYQLKRRLLDLPYMDTWATRLGIIPLWERLKAEAGTVED
jgi:hypothetical protein